MLIMGSTFPAMRHRASTINVPFINQRRTDCWLDAWMFRMSQVGGLDGIERRSHPLTLRDGLDDVVVPRCAEWRAARNPLKVSGPFAVMLSVSVRVPNHPSFMSILGRSLRGCVQYRP